jgi:glycosyltransferase involved in cell wall biosynthesis
MVTVSAVIPTRGRAALLRRAVLSALEQTLREVEAVVVVDGPDPDSIAALEELSRQDRRLKVLALPASVGGSDARNLGVQAASGEWVAFLDDDDEWLPGKLAAQLAAVRAAESPLIARTPAQDYIWPRRMPARGEQIGEYLLARRSLTRGEGYIQTSTFFVRRSLMLAQPFKSGQLKHQDTEWVLRLGRLPGLQIVFADEVLAIHNIEENRPTISSKSNWHYSLAWLRRDRHLFTPRALSGFVLHQIACEASEQGAWLAFPVLLLEALRYGRSTPRDFAIYLAIWLLPRRRRRLLRNWMSRRPLLHAMVHSL